MSLNGQTAFSCEGGSCDAVFFHDGALDDCETTDGVCEHLVKAGWLPVWLRVYSTQRSHLMTRGGFLCPSCSKKCGLAT